jgi:hypothetical protein
VNSSLVQRKLQKKEASALMTRIVAEVKHVEVKANKNSGTYFYYYISYNNSTGD